MIGRGVKMGGRGPVAHLGRVGYGEHKVALAQEDRDIDKRR